MSLDTWPLDQHIGYYRGNALKYIMRMGSKDMHEVEISKGQHYLEKLLEVLKELAMPNGKLRFILFFLELFNTCERKFELEKLLENPLAKGRVRTSLFGKAYGAGIGTYLSTQDKNMAIFSVLVELLSVVDNAKGARKQEPWRSMP